MGIRDRDNVIVLGSRAWHPGVVGIVASQLMRRYHKPTFVIAFDAVSYTHLDVYKRQRWGR